MSPPRSRMAGAVLCGCVVAALMTACSRMGRVVVEERDGLPCFGIENTVATRMSDPELSWLHIETQGEGSRETVWSFSVPKPIAFPPGQCLRYGEVPAEGVTHTVAQPLHVGRRYLVTLRARGNDPTDPTFAYTAELCLVRDSTGQLGVHEIQWDEKAGIWDRAVCAMPSAGSNS